LADSGANFVFQVLIAYQFLFFTQVMGISAFAPAPYSSSDDYSMLSRIRSWNHRRPHQASLGPISSLAALVGFAICRHLLDDLYEARF